MANMQTMDGNKACAYISYAFTEVAAIYPITPSSPMAEAVDEWAAHGKQNLFGQPVKVVEMQSEAGASGTVHGSLLGGALTTTYTASQGLLLMIPNMYKMAGELLPAVFHVSSRSLATHALSIFGDHQDVLACRQTGFALLASANVQEAMDLGCVAHLSSIDSRIPFLHFFEGFRTSHEYQKIDVLDYNDIEPLLNYEAVKEFRNRALNPSNPTVRGTAQNPDIYFQGREISNSYYSQVPTLVENYLKKLGRITGRQYHLFDYYGVPDAEAVIVAMGSVCDTIEETVDYLTQKGEKVGLLKVHLYRPFSESHFLNAMPPSVRRIAVLDRTKEPGATGEPLYLDTVKAFYNTKINPIIVGGRYGLGSKDTTPSQIIAVYNNLRLNQPKHNFTIGIVDDVTNLSLPEEDIVDTTPTSTISCKFWGLGSDGTVSANKAAIEIIGNNTDFYAQGYFAYDSKKSGGTTVSHLRFGKVPIKSRYLVYEADYIACHNKSFIYHYDILKGLKKGGTFVLNCPWSADELKDELPPSIKSYIFKNNIDFYTLNAVELAKAVGLGGRINMIMQTAFFNLAKILPVQQAIDYLKQSVVDRYGKKGQQIIDMNHLAIDRSLKSLQKIEVPTSWESAEISEEEYTAIQGELPFVNEIQRPMARQEGDELPVSSFIGMEDGTFPVGTTSYEKRGIAVMIPEWQIDRCIQCNQCSYICPHAVIRPILINEEEKQRAPDTFKTKKAIGRGLEDLEYRIQISPLDCTGCSNCADICPAPDKALIMKDAEQEVELESANWEYAGQVKNKAHLVNTRNVKGSQFLQPLFEFNGACPGCGETPYIKLVTQLFGDRMMIANATGCSSIYGASAPSIPYTTNDLGRGPTWANSLFEDNAEFGYGMFLAVNQVRDRLAVLMRQALQSPVNSPLNDAFAKWIEVKDDGEASKQTAAEIIVAAQRHNYSGNKLIAEIMSLKNFFIKPSPWIIGGDGWAYDIGYGGLDHVLASGDNVNLLVLDTEVYSNTGGQSSKATPTAAVAKFAAAGKRIRKKDLGLMAISYGYVYVAQIAMGANMNHTLKVLWEAEQYSGPSLIIAYSPCISHGIKSGMGTSIAQEKKAVESGYWHLYRYNPLLKIQNKNPFILDSKEPKESFREFLESEIRYSTLQNTFPEVAEQLFTVAEDHAQERYRTYKRMAQQQY